MNSTFYFNRFLKLVKTESLINKSTIIKILATLVVGMLIVYLVNIQFSITDLDNVHFVSVDEICLDKIDTGEIPQEVWDEIREIVSAGKCLNKDNCPNKGKCP
ncbi:MAG: hypothetical protein FWC41_11090, partial [Firmicutes bacterium]|nr:hypothetical protein [Bacillota bacterium]